jgi:initiation factor 1A
MVKNLTGGNKSKKQARCSFTPQQTQHVRKATEEGEIYAIVTKIFGGPNCQVMCNDGVSRSCIIRNKFKTFGKRDNIISIGVWILVGIRTWEVRPNGGQKCDLLEVYSQTEKDKLQQVESCSFKNLTNEDKNSDLIFSNNLKICHDKHIPTNESSSTDDENDTKEKVITKSLKDIMTTNNKNNTNNDTDWLNQEEQINVDDI